MVCYWARSTLLYLEFVLQYASFYCYRYLSVRDLFYIPNGTVTSDLYCFLIGHVYIHDVCKHLLALHGIRLPRLGTCD